MPFDRINYVLLLGAVGLIATPDQLIHDVIGEGHMLLLVGDTMGHLGQSALLAEVFNREDGDAPQVDLAAEKLNGDFIRAQREWIDVCTDVSDGGVAVAAFEMADAAGVGMTLDDDTTAMAFGEDQARYLIGCSFDKAEALMSAAGQAGVTLTSVGKFGGDTVTIGGSSVPLAELSEVYHTSFEAAVG